MVIVEGSSGNRARGISVRGKFVLSRNLWYKSTGSPHVAIRCSDPPAAYATGEPGQVQRRDRVGIVEGSCGYRAPAVSIWGKFVLSRNLGYKMRGRHVPAAVRHGRARQSSWTGRCGDCRRVL